MGFLPFHRALHARSEPDPWRGAQNEGLLLRNRDSIHLQRGCHPSPVPSSSRILTPKRAQAQNEPSLLGWELPAAIYQAMGRASTWLEVRERSQGEAEVEGAGISEFSQEGRAEKCRGY